jgi:hypothetical protein
VFVKPHHTVFCSKFKQQYKLDEQSIYARLLLPSSGVTKYLSGGTAPRLASTKAKAADAERLVCILVQPVISERSNASFTALGSDAGPLPQRLFCCYDILTADAVTAPGRRQGAVTERWSAECGSTEARCECRTTEGRSRCTCCSEERRRGLVSGR